MAKVLVLGKNGMLGSMTYSYLADKHKVIGSDRYDFDALRYTAEVLSGKVGTNVEWLNKNKDCDFVINCIGKIKPDITNPSSEICGIIINSIFPRLLANTCRNWCRVIHVTTDCVVSPKNQTTIFEDSLHTAEDVYGKSKSLGESDNAIVVRTSIIGPEKNKKKSLLEWFLSQEEVNGFTNHWWNGVTTLELAKCFDYIIQTSPNDGLYHVHSNTVNKYELLSLFRDVFKPSVKVNEAESEYECFRVLGAKSPIFQTKPIKEQLEELREYCKSAI